MNSGAPMNRVGNGAATAGAGGLGATLFDPSSGGVHMGAGGLDMGRAPAGPPGSLPRASMCGAGMPPMSPANVSAPSIAPHPGAGMSDSGLDIGLAQGPPVSLRLATTCGAEMPISPANVSASSIASHPGPLMGVGGADMRGAPGSSGGFPRATMCGAGMPPLSPANVSAPSIAPGPRRAQPRPALAMPQLLPVPQTTVSSGGVGGKRAAAETLAHVDLIPTTDHDSDNQRRTDGPGTSASTSTGGRRKGQLAQQASTCHGCRINKPTGNVRHACQGGDEGGEARGCNYWVCQKCMGRWMQASGQPRGFWCCLHSGREWCPCAERVSTKRSKTVSVVDRSRLAQNRQESTDVYEFPTTTSSPTAATTAASPTPPSGPGTTYSVCTSNSQNRVAVIKAGDRFLCSRPDCRRIEGLSSAATGDTASALPSRCAHAEVVIEAERTSMPMPKADALLSAGDFKSALDKVPAGTFNPRTVASMRARADQAAKEGLPLLVRVGNTKYFAVRDGQKFNRTVIGEWGHVKYDQRGSKVFQCKASNGSPCSDSSSRKSTGRCVHAAIVAVYIYDRYKSGVAGEELELERDGDMESLKQTGGLEEDGL
ncbi:unnamed protein product [Ectocarpus sp. CCAP 1310/34]|nr:unnamed protein product [Ectocarpus sp. CCAP 1310/34]